MNIRTVGRKFPFRFGRRAKPLALAFLLLGTFLKLTSEIGEGSGVQRIDESILRFVGSLRQPAWNGPAVDITALGSFTVVLLITVLGTVILAVLGRRLEALFLALSAAGAGEMSGGLKLLFHRPRPTVLSPLVEVTSYSYPSGHSIVSTAAYLALALIGCRLAGGAFARSVFLAGAILLFAAVGASRLYLGVHYPSDVLSGILLGGAWVFGLSFLLFSEFREIPLQSGDEGNGNG